MRIPRDPKRCHSRSHPISSKDVTVFDSGELGVCHKSLIAVKRVLDGDKLQACPSGLRHRSFVSDCVSKAEPESPSGSEEESENSKSEDEQERIRLEITFNLVLGGLRCVFSLRWLLIGLSRFFQYSRLTPWLLVTQNRVRGLEASRALS